MVRRQRVVFGFDGRQFRFNIAYHRSYSLQCAVFLIAGRQTIWP